MLLGVDVASVGGARNIDWRVAKAGGINFAFLRSNYGDETDSIFKREWPRLLDAGITRGAYLFLRHPLKSGVYKKGIKPPASPTKQAEAMVKLLNGLGIEPTDFPPIIDVEFSGDGRTATGLSAAECLDRVREAVEVVRDAYGVDPILYTSARVWRDDLSNLPAPDLAGCPLWLARYPFKAGPAQLGAALSGVNPPPIPPPWGDADNWWMHQYQGNAEGCPGFPVGKVDMNRFNPMVGADGKGARAKWVRDRLAGQDLADFQSERGLVADGVIGPRTFAYLAWQTVDRP